MRAVLDTTVLIAGLLSPTGIPASLIVRWFAGDFELVVSEHLLQELARVISYPKIRERISEADGAAFVELLRSTADMSIDQAYPAARAADLEDDYLLALAEGAHAVLVSGDKHLLELAEAFPVRTPAAFANALDQAR